MALPAYATEQLIENIKRRCSVPTSQLTYTDQDFTDLANDELQGEVVPLMMSCREEYFVTYTDVSTVASGYIEFPADAIGAKLRSVCYYQDTQPLTLINLPRLDLDTISGVGYANLTNVVGFYIEGNNLCLYPNNAVPVGTQIRIYYYKRSLYLAAPLSYGQIVSIDTLNSQVVLDFVPAAWVAGTELNAVLSTPNFSLTSSAIEVVSVSSPTVTLNNVTGLSVGDYISERGYSAIPQVPIEAHAYLAQLTAAKCLEGLGDTQGMKNAMDKAMLLKDKLLVMVSNRVDGSGKKVLNPTGGLRIGAGMARRGWNIW